MNFDESFVYLLSGLTSTAVFVFAVKRLGMKTFTLREVFVEISECVGTFVLFMLLNMSIGTVVTFLIRAFWKFFPLYAVTDLMLVMISGLQGFVFQLWWRRSRAGGSSLS